MIRVEFLFIALLWATPADAGCFLFFCAHHHYNSQRHHAHHWHTRIVHKTIVKKIIIVRERKVHDAHAPTVDITPITPLK